jgi:hypothetical protein
MELDDSAELAERIERFAHRRIRGPVEVIDNADSYTAIQPSMVLRLPVGDYFILGEAREGRFGIDDQPKLWVKFGIDLSDGARKIIKLPFLEAFEINVGPFRLRCSRNPDKESRVLAAVAGDPRFMHGITARDRLGHNIRIIEEIRGVSLYRLIAGLDLPHEQYFHERAPEILDRVLDSLDALEYLHRQGEQHGDVRNDHLWVDSTDGSYRWIDFDYEANYLDYDIWSVGNVLSYVICGGILTCRDAHRLLAEPGRPGCIEPEDAMVFFDHRLANLKKVYPYVPEALNRVMMRFSMATSDFYERVADIVADVRAALA